MIFVILDIVMFSLPRQLYPPQLTKCWSFQHYFPFSVERRVDIFCIGSSEPLTGETEHIILEPAQWILVVSSQIWTLDILYFMTES